MISKRWSYDGHGFTVIWDEWEDCETGEFFEEGRYLHHKKARKCFQFTREQCPEFVLLAKGGKKLWTDGIKRKKIRKREKIRKEL